MATTGSGEASVVPDLLPSFEELFRKRQTPPLSTHAKRLCWKLDGPLATAITVLQQPYPEPGNMLEPYCTSHGNNLTWHAVAQAPYTEPKISSVTVSVSQIDD
jgi:hypothetical protein